MPEFGKFYQETFVDTTTPPINADRLNELERVVALADNELARTETVKFALLAKYMFLRNTKYVQAFSNSAIWTEAYPSQTTVSDSTNFNNLGNVSLQIMNDLATAGYMSVYDTHASKALNYFTDGVSLSSTDDFIVFVFYVSNATGISQIEFKFGDDFSNSYRIIFSSYNTGWNVKYTKKSDFTTIGSPSGWQAITYTRISPYVEAGYSGAFVIFDFIQMVRMDADYSSYINPFQKYWGSVTGWQNKFSIPTDYNLLWYDHNDHVEKIGIMRPAATANRHLYLYSNVIEFIGKFEMYCKQAGETMSIFWYASAGAWAEVYISSDNFNLTVYDGATHTEQASLTNGLELNEKIYIYFEKEEDTFRAILIKEDELPIVCEYESSSISSDTDGDIMLGQDATTSLSLLTDFEIGNKKSCMLKDENAIEYVRLGSELDDNQSFSNNSMADVTNLFAYIGAGKTYKLDLYLVCDCDSATPDIKLSWVNTNCHLVTNRTVLGPAVGTTAVGDTNVRMTELDHTSEYAYGLEAGGNQTFIRESFILKCEDSFTGKIQLRAAQNTTDGSNPVEIKYTSYFTLTPVIARKS